MKALRFGLRLLFWPIGALVLGTTAVFELMSDRTDWEFWRGQNRFFLEAMWLKRKTPCDGGLT